MSPQRLARLRHTLATRQPDFTVLMDNVFKAHNLAAIVRTCDAVGVPKVHAYSPEGDVPRHWDTTSGSARWVEVVNQPSLATAIDDVKQEYPTTQVLTAHLSDTAIDFRDADYTRPTILLMGSEKLGPSAEGIACADQHVVIPMTGLVESLNVSVAAALLLFEAKRQREAAGLYDQPSYSPEYMEKTLFEWAQPKMARYCQRYGLEYPALDEDGHIIGTLPQPGDLKR